MSETPRRRPHLLLIVAAVLTLAAMAVVVWRPVGLGADDWTWAAAKRPEWERGLAPLLCFGLIGGLVLAVWRRVERVRRLTEVVLVAALVILAFAAQIAVGRQATVGYHESIFAVGLPKASSYHDAACRIERMPQYLRHYVEEVRRPPFRVQLSTHPAGPVVLFWSLNQVFAGNDAGARRFARWCEDWLAQGMRLADSPRAAALFSKMTPAEQAGVWLATLVLRLAACLTLVPVYLMARRHGRTTAIVAASFAAAIPSLLLFSPGLDQTYPVLAVTACGLASSAGERRSLWRAAACGLTVSVGLFFTLAFAVVGAWSGALALAGLCVAPRPGRLADGAKLLAAGLLGLLVPVASVYAAFGYDSFGVWRACWDGNATFNALTRRAYGTWLLLNPVEYLVTIGVPVACLFVRRAASEAWALPRRSSGGHDWATLAVAGLLLVLNVLGANRGEVPRLWIFLMPACAIAAAAEIERTAPYRRAVFGALFALQAVQVVVFKATLNVLGIE
jgi:hypothetical protein